jgi:DNA primase
MDLAQRIKDKIILSDLLGQYVNLRQRGRYFLGLCPFHNEKTPSFTVNNDRAMFYCFGCGKHGDAFSFIQEKLNISFPAALEKLAKEQGIPLPQKKLRISQSSNRVLEAAQEIYHQNLPKILPYITARKITKETARAFQLGFSDKDTIKKLLDRGFSRSEIETSGLAGRGLDDRFKGRLIIPIYDRRQKIIGFSGRIMGDKPGAKYINSPETATFQKGFHLYNENQLRYEPVIVTEGYFDAISLWSAGFNAVAIMGTGFTKEQIAILWRYSRKLYIAFDDDAAGKNAIKRSLPLLLGTLKPEREVCICNFPEDPDALLQKIKNADEKKNVVDKILEKSLPLDNYIREEVLEPANSTQSHARRLEAIDNYLGQIKNIHLRRAYASYLKGSLRKKTKKQRVPKIHSKEMQVMSIFFYRPELAEQNIETLTKCSFKDTQLEKIRLFFIDQILDGCPLSQLTDEIRQQFPKKTRELLDFGLKIKKTNSNFLSQYLFDLLDHLIAIQS